MNGSPALVHPVLPQQTASDRRRLQQWIRENQAMRPSQPPMPPMSPAEPLPRLLTQAGDALAEFSWGQAPGNRDPRDAELIALLLRLAADRDRAEGAYVDRR